MFNSRKTYIQNGIIADVIVIAVNTDLKNYADRFVFILFSLCMKWVWQAFEKMTKNIEDIVERFLKM